MSMTDEEWAAQFAQDVLDAERNGWAPPRPEVKDLAENYLKLRDRLRWRDAVKEPPTEPTVCLVILGDNQYVDVTTWHEDAPWWSGIIKWWRPIGPFPELTP